MFEECLDIHVSNVVVARQFAILFNAACERITKTRSLGCPPYEFQLETDECVNLITGGDVCLGCWERYTRTQAMIDLGLIESVGTIEVEQLTDEEIKKADRAGTRYMDDECRRVANNATCCTEGDDSFD